MGEVYLACDCWNRRRSGVSEGVIADVSRVAMLDERLGPSVDIKTGLGAEL